MPIKKKKSKRKEKKDGMKKLRSAENEIELLRRGHVPNRSKIGSNFKGKNKIIVS